MKRRQPERTSLATLLGFTLVIVAVVSPGDIHGQNEAPDDRTQLVVDTNEVPVQLVEDIDLLTRLKWTLQVLFVPRSIDHVNPLYAYHPASVQGQEIHLERVGPVARVRGVQCFSLCAAQDVVCAVLRRRRRRLCGRRRRGR